MFNQSVNASVESWYGRSSLSDLRDIDVNTAIVNVSISSRYDRVEIESSVGVSVVWEWICV